MKIKVDYLKPIKLHRFESVRVVLTSGNVVSVFDDTVYIATPEQWASHLDGEVIWKGSSDE